MPALGLALLGLYGLLAFGLRMAIQVRRTGSTGFKGFRGASRPVEWIAGILFVSAIALCLGGIVLELIGALDPIEAIEGGVSEVLGVVLAAIGIVTTTLAQLVMGDAWRIGVDPCERTQLVTHGIFSIVRNPIYAAMLHSFAGIALLAPNAVTLAGAILLVVALEMHVRLVEEAYLRNVHGEQYALYAAKVGRFFPLVGRLRLSSGHSQEL
jgi:protein-S-isoprenylcysteine O-methyltransferase Ste14